MLVDVEGIPRVLDPNIVDLNGLVGHHPGGKDRLLGLSFDEGRPRGSRRGGAGTPANKKQGLRVCRRLHPPKGPFYRKVSSRLRRSTGSSGDRPGPRMVVVVALQAHDVDILLQIRLQDPRGDEAPGGDGDDDLGLPAVGADIGGKLSAVAVDVLVGDKEFGHRLRTRPGPRGHAPAAP